MGTCRFVIGTVNQGRLTVGETYSAYRQNTIFLSGICSADSFLDEPSLNTTARMFIKNIGGLCLELSSIKQIDDSLQIAELAMVDDTQSRYDEAIDYLFRSNSDGYTTQRPPIMTLNTSSALKVGDQLGIGYLSILQPKGEGYYMLKHDYPIERTQGPRYENFKESESQ